MVEDGLVRNGLSSPSAGLQVPPSGVDRDNSPDVTSRATPGSYAVNKKNESSSRVTLNGDEVPDVHATTSPAAQSEF